MVWQAALFFSLVFGSVRTIIDKELADRLDPLLLFFHLNLWGTVFFILFYFFRYQSFPPIYLEMAFLGILFIIIMICYYAAIRINLSQTVVFSAYYLIVAMALSVVFLGEWQLFNPAIFSGQKAILGTFLAIISLFLILKSHSQKEAKMGKTWFFLILTDIILMGIATFWGKAFLFSHGPLESLISQSIGAFPVLFLLILMQKKSFSLSFKNNSLVLLDGLLMVFSAAFFYYALKRGPIIIILPIQTIILTAISALIGLIIFKEVHLLEKSKLIGFCLGALGVILLVL